MYTRYEDLTGQKFGLLTVIKKVENSRTGRTQWLTQCSCPIQGFKIATAKDLKREHVTSCGCLGKKNKDRAHNMNKKKGYRVSEQRLSQIWAGMIQRCYNPRSGQFHNYGGRTNLDGSPNPVTVCFEWRNPVTGSINFIEWAKANGEGKGLQLDRIDPWGNYEPNNCRFVTNKKNSNNRRNTKFYYIGKKKYSLSESIEAFGGEGVTSRMVRDRMNRNRNAAPEDKKSFLEMVQTPKGFGLNPRKFSKNQSEEGLV